MKVCVALLHLIMVCGEVRRDERDASCPDKEGHSNATLVRNDVSEACKRKLERFFLKGGKNYVAFLFFIIFFFNIKKIL